MIVMLLASLAVSIGVNAAESKAPVFHVSPDGNDADAGSKAKPFRTLERARDGVRKWKTAHGDRRTLTPGNNAVINCDIYRVNRWDRTYKAPVNIDGAGNHIVNNHLHNCPGGGIYLHGNDHRIEYNEFDHLLTYSWIVRHRFGAAPTAPRRQLNS